MPRSAPPRRVRPSCICMRATRQTAARPVAGRVRAHSCKVIKQRSDAVINITTGGAPTMTLEERRPPAARFKPEVASLNMGSMNFGLYPMLDRFKTFEARLGGALPRRLASDRIFRTPSPTSSIILSTCAENGTRFEIECYDIGHLYTLAHFVDRGLVQAAVLRAERVRHPGRHRPPSGGCRAHEAHGRPAVRRSVSLVGTRRRPQPDADRGHGGRHGRQRPRRARRFSCGWGLARWRPRMPTRCAQLER